MARILIYGAGNNGKHIFDEVNRRDNVVGFIDSDEALWGKKIYSVEIISPHNIANCRYDYIIISVADEQVKMKIVDTLVNKYSVLKEKIEIDYQVLLGYRAKARYVFLRCCSEILYDNNIQGSVAEAGVYKGEFAKYINTCFPDRKLYLFDTFEGFDDSDIKSELSVNPKFNFYLDFKDGSEEYVKSIMPYKNQVVIIKGHFPKSAMEIDDKFAFVNLDMDLYEPTLRGLEFFYPKMARGGIILVHDYFRKDLQGVKKAVHRFCERNEIAFSACSDDCSIVITK